MVVNHLIDTIKNATINTTITESGEVLTQAPQWMHDFVDFRQRLFLATVEPVIVALLGPCEEETQSDGDNRDDYKAAFSTISMDGSVTDADYHASSNHRRLNFFPDYISDLDEFHESSMSFATLFMLFFTMGVLFLIFLSCFYHNQKTSPLFISPRRHRLPKLVPPPMPVDGYFSWIKMIFFLSDEEVIHRIGYDSLIFLRFHRLALRCIVKMSIFSFVVLLPVNFTGSGHANAQDLKAYVGSLFFTDFMRFTMANVMAGSSKLWIHCVAAYLLTGIVVRELLIEYETFNSIRHRYLLSREPHLRTVLVTNIPRNLRSSGKISSYFHHVYPNNAVKNVVLCQNLIQLEKLVEERTDVLAKIENELLLLCRSEKKKLYEQQDCCSCCCCPTDEANTAMKNPFLSWQVCLDCFRGGVDGTQERLAEYYNRLENLNTAVYQEQRRRKRVMKMLDRMDAGEGRKDIDYVLASPNVPNQSHNQPFDYNQQHPTFGHPEAIPEEGEDEDMPYQNLDEGQMTPPVTENNESNLRSRSPANPVANAVGSSQADGYNPKDETTKERSSFSKAKVAIHRYGRSKRDVTFLGRPIKAVEAALRADAQAMGKLEQHLNEVTDKAFVIMRTYTAATIAIQSMHSSKPGSMQVSTAPEPRDILWNNIYMSKGAQRTRSYIGEFVIKLLICFYIIPIAIVSLLVSESALVSSSPRLAQLDQASSIFSVAIALVQPICIVGLQQLLPPLFMSIGQAEGRTSFSEVQMQTFSRYFFFQVLNVFLVTTIAGTIFDTVAIIIEKPESAFEMLGNSLPRTSSFFISFVILKTFLGLGVELVRVVSLFQAIGRFFLFPNSTLRTKRKVLLGMRPIDDPGWFSYHKLLAQDQLVVVVSVVFSVVAPLVLLPCAVFFLFSRILWTHQHLYVYESVFETGGQFWPKIFRRFVFGLIIAQMTITGQFILKEARPEAYATMALMFMTYFFLRSTRARYDPTSSTLPLEVATVMDITLQQEEEARKREVGETVQDEGNPSLRSFEDDEDNDSPGRLIGNYDPFRKAYMQPALRATPKARPEQPFPPAQLGREDTFFADGAEDDESSGLQESDANVQVRSMDSDERRMINRWWENQFRRAGPQNFFKVLIGEECGTLTLSATADDDIRTALSVEGHAMV